MFMTRAITQVGRAPFYTCTLDKRANYAMNISELIEKLISYSINRFKGTREHL